ncbi:MAG: LysR family transcriptional regulator, partial [Pseudomonadota bacterium]
MDLKQLKNCVAIVDHGSFLKAASALAISQPALSRSIAKLEDANQTKVLDRTTRGLQMTPAGKRLYRRARLILNETAAAHAEIRAGGDTIVPFRIGVAPLFEGEILPDAVTSFCIAEPEAHIQVRSGLFPRLARELSEGSLDIVVSNIPFAPIEDNLTAMAMFDIDVLCLVSQDHPLAQLDRVQLADTMAFPWAVIDEANANTLYDYLFSTQGTTKSPIQLRTNSLNLLRNLVRHPPWVTMIPQHMVQADLQAGALKVIDLGDQNLIRKGGLLFRSAMKDDPHLKR